MRTTSRETAAMGWCDGVLGCDISRFAISVEIFGVAAGGEKTDYWDYSKE